LHHFNPETSSVKHDKERLLVDETIIVHSAKLLGAKALLKFCSVAPAKAGQSVKAMVGLQPNPVWQIP